MLRRTRRGGRCCARWDVTVDTVALSSATKGDVPVAPHAPDSTFWNSFSATRAGHCTATVLFGACLGGGEMDDGTRTLDLHIQRPRAKSQGWQEHIKTVYKVGYLLEMEGEP